MVVEGVVVAGFVDTDPGGTLSVEGSVDSGCARRLVSGVPMAIYEEFD